MQAPLAILLSLLAGSTAIAELLLYYIALYGLISLKERAGQSVPAGVGMR